MKITPQYPEKKAFGTSMIRFFGILEFFGVLTIVSIYSKDLGIGLIAGLIIGINPFILAGIIDDIHAIRVNTNGYETEPDKEDFRPLLRAIKQMNENLEIIQDLLVQIKLEIIVSNGPEKASGEEEYMDAGPSFSLEEADGTESDAD